MTSTDTFKFVLMLLAVIVALQLIARRMRLPTAAALLAGGTAIAFIPGVPAVSFDPELVLTLFLPPLLLNGAFYTVWFDFRRYLRGILWLAVGAVVFTTAIVGWAVHAAVPQLPWAVCFVLGAVVSPPDAVAAKAVLSKVRLPRRASVLLEGESLLNDATGIVLYRFAAAAALTGAFSAKSALISFGGLALGGVAVGVLVGLLAVFMLRRVRDVVLAITLTFLMPWVSYIGGEALHVSGVTATVTAGIWLGYFQHDVYSAHVRLRGSSFWAVVIFLLEALVFTLMGFSLRGVIERLGGVGHALATLSGPIGMVLVAVVASRFVWIFGTDYARVVMGRMFGHRHTRVVARESFLLSWAGMRGVVTLAIALSLPMEMAGRDLIVAAAFAVILVTVIVQGGAMGPLIRWLGLRERTDATLGNLSEVEIALAMDRAQLAVIRARAFDNAGQLMHPRLLEQYSYRVTLREKLAVDPGTSAADRELHHDIVLASITAARAELLRLHKAGCVHAEHLRHFERDMDLRELQAENDRASPS